MKHGRFGAGLAGLLAGATALAGMGLTACGGHSGPSGVLVNQQQTGGLGPVLTTATGMTLYMFPPDDLRRVSCVGTCAGAWPPYTTPAGTEPKAGKGVQSSLLGTDPNPAGGPPVVTYDHWPLYTFRGDHAPGDTKGQALDADGGYWYVISPTGQPITVADS